MSKTSLATLEKANSRYNINHNVSEIESLHLNTIRIRLTTIEALDPFRLIAIFYALNDITMAAKSSVMSELPLK